ncbi:MAG: DUF1499 domain-containing protein [Halobacteriovoraceae bacterium]|mgnify:CR=1 FL=1|jgi:uncharacterized protein (DUF1499 family)|nr:DUF1499 domain-containing protein [Halobacteriovoraceae bacterium]
MIIKILYFSAAFLLLATSASAQPKKIGLSNLNGKKRLHPCPKSPNCVSSHNDNDDKDQHISAVSYQQKEKKFKQVKECIKKRKGTKIIKETPHYIHFTSESSFMGFVDDTEFYFDEEQKKMHFRSSSRTGYSDFGVNRKRIQALIKNCK